VRLAITSNGPGEFSGWVRPLVAALLRLDPETDVTVFFVPDDYATGREPDVAQRLFPSIRVVPPKDYVRFALGRGRPANVRDVDLVQYLGGDLMHAARVRARLGGNARSYKFVGRRGSRTFERVYAIDARNAEALAKTGYPAERIETVGNLVIDGALGEAAGAFGSTEPPIDLPPGGVLFMPGARRNEIANMIPFFLQTAVHLRRIAPELPAAFALSPFTTRDEVERALAAGGHPNVWGARGRVTALHGGIGLQPDAGGPPLPVVRDAMRYAPRARFAVTLPGTKCIELAALGVPTLVCVPLNAPEAVVVNGPLQYIDRIPAIGAFVKRQVVIGVDLRFKLTAQPNIDTGEQLMPELRGTLMPAEVARRIAAYALDADARAEASRRLRELYVAHAGAAERMARSLLGAGKP
jgi:hypothetical protein